MRKKKKNIKKRKNKIVKKTSKIKKTGWAQKMFSKEIIKRAVKDIL